MTARPLAVGIDVVDRGDPRCRGKASDGRFIGRVFAPEEARAIAEDADPDGRLWALWAAKEAAFKVVSKVEGRPPPFEHAAFRVGGDGAVRWKDREVPYRPGHRDGATVVLAWEKPAGDAAAPAWDARPAAEVDPAPGEDLAGLLLAHLHAAERPPVHSRPSALVRIAARRGLATALAVDEARIDVVCPGGPTGRTPPVALLDGRPAPADVSLSHHGAWIAWAVRVG